MSDKGIRKRILEAIQLSGLPCWLTYRENQTGIAGYLDFFTSKVYLEIFFLPKSHPKAPITIKSFTKLKGLDINELTKKLKEIKEKVDSYIDPVPVLRLLDEFRTNFIETIKRDLQHELDLVGETYENVSIEGNEFFREFLIHTPSTIKRVQINFRNYPQKPDVFVERSLLAGTSELGEAGLKSLKKWHADGKHHVMDIIDEIAQELFKGDLSEARSYQVVSGKNLMCGKTALEFQLPRGTTFGILDERGQSSEVLEEMHSAMTKQRKQEEISIFGKPVRGKDAAKDVIAWIDETPVKFPGLSRIGGNVKQAVKPRRDIKNRKEIFKLIIQDTGLDLIRRERVKNLQKRDNIIANIALALASGKEVLYLDFGKLGITRLEHEQYRKILTAIAYDFHVIVIVAAPEGVLSSFSKVITITSKERTCRAGTVDEIQSGLPGDIIVIQVTNATQEFPRYIAGIAGKYTIEEIPLERYRIFVKEGGNKIMVDICKKFPDLIYKMTITKPNLDDYIRFVGTGAIQAI